ISYSYQVDGVTYQGNQLRHWEMFSAPRDWHSRVVHDHPAGANTTVYYDPEHPENSVVIAGLQGIDLFLIMALSILGTFLLIL
ncbi:unnamed protein product, partial [Phaeothamnion confervicola]